MSQIRRQIVVSGRVQGVGYRYFCQEQARALGLTGWVRNCPNSTVELEAQGPAENIDRLLADLARGPVLSRVDGVRQRPLGLVAGEKQFVIRS